jgi:hypothetical protein
MTSADSVVVGHHVGSMRGAGGVRHVIAFDLTGVAPSCWSPQDSVLEVAVAGLAPRPGRLRLLDDNFRAYGTYRLVGRAEAPRAMLELDLTPRALADLEQAAGGFYSVVLALGNAASPDAAVEPVLRVRPAVARAVAALPLAA